MPEFAWTQDYPTGPLKNHALSRRILSAAIAASRFNQFVETEPGYGRHKGESITVPRIKNMTQPASAEFDEQERVPVDRFSMTSTEIRVRYYGRGVEYTEMSELLAHFDLTDRIQAKLKSQMQLSLDTEAATAFKRGPIKFIPTGTTTGAFETTQTPVAIAANNVQVAHIQLIRDYLMDTIHCPGWRGNEYYYCLASTKFLRGIKNDPVFVDWQKAQRVEPAFMRGIVGSIENVQFIEVNHTRALRNNLGTGGVLGEGVVFGEDAVSMAVAQDPELRAALPGNFGLSHAVAWIGLMGWAVTWPEPDDGHARIVHVTSAPPA
jgi:N4-gp56 family major capsid protein